MSTPSVRIHYKVSNGEMIVGGICRDTDCLLPEHEHAEGQLTILFSGSAPTLLTHGESGKTQWNDLRPDSFIFLPPDQPHRLNWSDYGEVLHLFMRHEDLLILAEASKCPIPQVQLGDYRDRGIFEIGRLLVDEFDATGGLTPAMLDHATALMMARMLRVNERLTRESFSGVLSVSRLQPAINVLNDCPEREFTLAGLANLCHSSVFHFARSFTVRMGCAPFAYQRQLRLKKAQLLLVTTDLSIEAIGSSVGFENATHFSRMFRRQTGYAPRNYRRLHSSEN